jgi:hypothetical protein
MSQPEYDRPAASAPLVQPEGVNAGSAAQIDEPAKPKGRHRAESRPASAALASAAPATAGQAAEPNELVGAPPNDPASGQDAGSME